MEQQAEAITKSTRDPAELRARLERWLADRLPGTGLVVTGVNAPLSNGMSSETLLVDAVWDDGTGDGPTEHHLVARVAPDTKDVPVFPTYDLEAQFEAMRLVAAEGGVPVPPTRWLELDPDVLGAPFFVMERVEGRVPPDNLPYTFEGWLLDATDEERHHLRDRTLEAMAAIHNIDVAALEREGRDLSWLRRATDHPDAGATALRRHVDAYRRYYDWVRGDASYPILEAAFDWLDEHWPDDEGDVVISWGDARIGNVMYEGFTPVAVLDWEMVALGPRGIDLGWFSFLHTFFQDITEQLGLPGLPGFMDIDVVARSYHEGGGVPVDNLDWYVVYAALRHGIVMVRVHQRQVHFGEAEPAAHPDQAVMHRARLAELIGYDLPHEAA